MREPRGIRNHNPGNIEIGDPWQGQVTPSADPRFCQFKSAIWGIRAVARVLITYQDKRRAPDGTAIDTVREIVARWAPPGENDTAAYVAAVLAHMDAEPGTIVDLHDYQHARPIVEAIIRHENGIQPYTDAQLDKALVLAGIEPPAAASLAGSRTIRGGQVAASAGALSVAVGAVQGLAPAMPLLRDVLAYAPWVVGLAVLAGVGWMVWARLDDRRRGLR